MKLTEQELLEFCLNKRSWDQTKKFWKQYNYEEAIFSPEKLADYAEKIGVLEEFVNKFSSYNVDRNADGIFLIKEAENEYHSFYRDRGFKDYFKISRTLKEGVIEKLRFLLDALHRQLYYAHFLPKPTFHSNSKLFELLINWKTSFKNEALWERVEITINENDLYEYAESNQLTLQLIDKTTDKIDGTYLIQNKINHFDVITIEKGIESAVKSFTKISDAAKYKLKLQLEQLEVVIGIANLLSSNAYKRKLEYEGE